MKKFIRINLIILLVALVIIQFFRPPKNTSNGKSISDISNKYEIPPDVVHILKVACRDCHSDNTRYPFYWHIQPIAWFMNGHITQAKSHLNFSIFTTYSIAKQYKLFDHINKMVKKGNMPLPSYTLIHRDADLSDSQKIAIENWSNASRKKIEENYPADSLQTARQ